MYTAICTNNKNDGVVKIIHICNRSEMKIHRRLALSAVWTIAREKKQAENGGTTA
jgi:hypothetical protein